MLARAAALAACLAPALAHAQRAAVRGQVVTADSTHRPVGGAEVLIQALGRSARVADDGTFLLDGLKAGTHALLVRRVGFEPVTSPVTLRDGDTLAVNVALAVRVVELAKVDVKDKATAPALRAFERERALHNGGAFVSDSLLAANEFAPMSNVLRRIPGANVIRLMTPTGSRNVLGSSRGAASTRPGARNCYYAIYLDGIKVWAPGVFANDVPPDLDELKTAQFEAIEIYRGGAQTPSQYAGTGAACGTALFWSRSRVSH